MKKRIYSLILSMAIFGSFSVAQTSNQSKGQTGTQTQQQKKEVQPVKETKVVYTCPMHPSVSRDKPGKCPICGMALVKKDMERPVAKVTYSCPMHPEVVSDNPGKCPKCKMALVEKKPAKQENSPKK
jgi:hypothetical protein